MFAVSIASFDELPYSVDKALATNAHQRYVRPDSSKLTPLLMAEPIHEMQNLFSTLEVTKV